MFPSQKCSVPKTDGKRLRNWIGSRFPTPDLLPSFPSMNFIFQDRRNSSEVNCKSNLVPHMCRRQRTSHAHRRRNRVHSPPVGKLSPKSQTIPCNLPSLRVLINHNLFGFQIKSYKCTKLSSTTGTTTHPLHGRFLTSAQFFSQEKDQIPTAAVISRL